MQGFLKELGSEGEGAAAAFLEGRGFRILAKNYRCRLGEVDLIVQKKGLKAEKILFVEVKTRRSIDTVSPLELISRSKQKHISRVAQHYFASKKLNDVSGDFALVTVHWASDEKPICELIEGIFDLAWGY